MEKIYKSSIIGLSLLCMFGSFSFAVEDFAALYKNAVEDAKTAYPEEVRNLTPLTPDNKETVWIDGKILMCSLVPQWAVDRFFMPAFKGNKIFVTPQDRDMWVTPVPQLKNFVKAYKQKPHMTSDPNMLSRVEMLLGLPVKPEDYAVVEFLIDPQHLYRPCPDKEIDDLVCEADTRHDNPEFDIFQEVKASPEHKKWFLNEKQSKYIGSHPFPWTRLGYTYDYYKKAMLNEPEGLSEYIIQPNVPITIYSVSPLNDYE